MKVKVFSDRTQDGAVDPSKVTFEIDAKTPMNICCGDNEIWIDVTTGEGEKYVFEIDTTKEEK